jgi:DNA-binding NarL/FixJ family response regulator
VRSQQPLNAVVKRGNQYVGSRAHQNHAPDQQVLKLLVQGCSNKEIGAELNISPRTVKQHLRTLFLRAGIKQGRKRVILATAVFEKEQMNYVPARTVELHRN